MTKIWHDKRGNAMIIAAAALPLLIGSAGLATDTIQWALWKRQLQRAADSAAIAGVYDRVAAKATTGTAAAVDKDLGLNNSLDSTKFPLQTKTVTFPADVGTQKNQVKVDLAVRRPLSFSSMFMASAPLIKTSATAAAVSSEGEFCVLSLQNNSKTGIQAAGNAAITMDCGMMTNSTSTNSAAGQGSSSVTATTLAAAGGIQQSSNWHLTEGYQPYSPALEDPYKDLVPDSNDFSSCASSPPSLTINNSNSGLQVDGGACYSSLSIGTNRVLTLKNGVYVISGGSVNIQGTLNLTNAVLLLTNKASGTQPIGSLDMNASGQMNATAMTTGKWKGMAIYQDRRATDSAPTGNITASSPNKINGNSTNKITGVVYFPNQQVTYNGDGTGSATCTQFVAKRIYWSGNSGTNNFTKNCDMYGISAIKTGLRVRLVA
ncbi:MAG: Tad domain-containing protein [Sphingomicrobium sp.]